ncbi:MAG: hypothetical protein HKO59_01330 [Phycisphaerales bacterium]|nr:hypothetical protein [Phycisphaerae bacterium]NNF43444.1 hypothetical protein [Phycisphaerales bacterium]NNM24622.1 hypothetical protein [Phycisphaerales bacterium]
MDGPSPPLFVPGLFLRVLIIVMFAVLVTFVVIYLVSGPISTVDTTGTLICTPIVAYLVHLWLAPMDPIDHE